MTDSTDAQDMWWKTDKVKEVAAEKKHSSKGCKYCTFNAHFSCKPVEGVCEDYLWNGKNPTVKYCDDCKLKTVCKIKKNRDKRDIPIEYCGFWRDGKVTK